MDNQSHFRSTCKFNFPCSSDHLSGRSSSFKMQDCLMGDGFLNGKVRNRLLTSKRTAETVRSDHLQPSWTREHKYCVCEIMGPKVVQSSKKSREEPLNAVVRANILINSEGGGPFGSQKDHKGKNCRNLLKLKDSHRCSYPCVRGNSFQPLDLSLRFRFHTLMWT